MEGTIQTTFNALTTGKVNHKICSVEEWEDKRKLCVQKSEEVAMMMLSDVNLADFKY